MFKQVAVFICLLALSSCAVAPESSSDSSTSKTVHLETEKLEYEMTLSLYIYLFMQKRSLKKELATLSGATPRAIAITSMISIIDQQCAEIETSFEKKD